MLLLYGLFNFNFFLNSKFLKFKPDVLHGLQNTDPSDSASQLLFVDNDFIMHTEPNILTFESVSLFT